MYHSMWSIPDSQNVIGPVQIMREQGEALLSLTSGKLQGSIQATGHGDEIIRNFNIVVPSLGYYAYTLCAYAQSPLAIYPGRFFSSFSSTWYGIADEEEFVRLFGEFLGSSSTNELIGSLLSQAS